MKFFAQSGKREREKERERERGNLIIKKSPFLASFFPFPPFFPY